jgi:ribosome-associated translation inhibitor RaiA
MDVAVTARGKVTDAQKDRARERVSALDHCVSDPVLGARVMLRYERNPRLTRPARAEAELNVNGHMLRGRVASATMSQAIDQLGNHLERQLHGFVDRRARLKRRAGEPRPGEWHHGAASPPRPSFHPRPVQERSIVRRKSFALGAIDPLQAVRDLLDLDHDFYLFHDAETDADAVVYRRRTDPEPRHWRASRRRSPRRSESRAVGYRFRCRWTTDRGRLRGAVDNPVTAQARGCRPTPDHLLERATCATRGITTERQ